MLFALVAGAGTALSPCVLPILPAVLGAGVTGGRRRPLGVVTGLVLAFAFSAVALVYLIDALGLPNDIQRIIAIVVLAGFGIALLIPPVADRLEAAISRVVGAPRMQRADGFWSGTLLGAALGLAYFPCAGPILAGVITVSAAQDFTVGRLAVALSYALGSGIVLYAIMRPRPALHRSARPDPGPGPDGHGRRHARRRAGHGDRPRSQLRAVDRDRPPRLPDQPDRVDRAQRRGRLRDRRTCAAATGTRSPPREAGRRPRRASAFPTLAPRASSRIRSSGSTRPGGEAALDRRAQRRGQDRAGRLLDLHVHQLHPHAALPRGLGPQVPQGRARRRRRALARVPVREGRRQRCRRDRLRRHPLSGRPGQRARHLELLSQPVLARPLSDRHERQNPLHALRRGRLRADRGRDPLPARRRRQTARSARTQAPARSRSPRMGSARPRPTSAPPEAPAGSTARPPQGSAAGGQAGLRHGRQPDPQGAAAERVRLSGQLGRDGRGRALRATARASTSASRQPASTW